MPKFNSFPNSLYLEKGMAETLEIVKILGVGLISLVIIIILRQYKPEFTIYVSLIAGAIILFLVMDKLYRNNKPFK